MEIKRGIPVSAGVAIGEAFVLDSEDYRIPKRFINKAEIKNEVTRYLLAVEKSVEELKGIAHSTKHLKDISIIFQGHRFIIEDPDLQKEIINKIEKSSFTAEYAVSHIMGKHRQKLESYQSEFYTRRLSDLEDIESRLLKHLIGAQREKLDNLQYPVILIASDLKPSQTAILPMDRILGFVTDIGGRTSHTAIVARTRGIPAVVGLGSASTQVCGGDIVIIDGQKGIVIVDPDVFTLENYKTKQIQERQRKEKLKKLIDLPIETVDGYRIKLRANIETPSEVKAAMENGAMGIGLYRTEFIYVNNIDPSEEDHFNAYKEAIKNVGNNKIIIRTLDFGADKDFGIEEFQGEKNPFLGCRAIRLCFEKIHIFKRQLRAILRASIYGEVDIMFPMISSLGELIQAKGVLEETKKELLKEGIDFNQNIRVGIMIEIPSAALISDLLAKEVDFFSIGTNDLIQYTLAVDRINERVAHLYQPAHPAIFRLIKHVVDVARENEIKVSICGEMSAEFAFIIPLMGLGLRSFSLSPSLIPEAKELIRRITIRKARVISAKVRACKTHEEAVVYLNKELSELHSHEYI